MKSSFLRPAMALALALGLSACGGGAAKFTVAGTVAGLIHPGLVLSNGGADLAVAANATSFAFPNAIEYGETYDVTVKTQPAHQTCTSTKLYSSGTAGQTAAINGQILCSLNTFTIGGTVTGLTAEGLVLTNGTDGGTVTVAANATAYSFILNPVKYGDSYGVTILTQPTGQTCTLVNGVGQMGDAKVENINVTCQTSIGS
ncbi:hypothetical protein [Massilia cavernae]|uniref:Lipoprotein n=1 Tax=Massilia cavernae TaxID=2320864 RepID=A0A418Y5M5_9BURK|nr:hypothetical protein [Massilia cavernae]RJG22197.1 hypothetical protein D3872_05745 [Massilia cavernae]